LVFVDELDKMITDGQTQSLNRIQRRVLSDYTGIICTETFDSEIKKTGSYFAKDAAIVGFGQSQNGRAATPPFIPEQLKQSYINVPYRMKISTLMAYVRQSSAPKNVIFTASKRGADRLYRALKKQNMQATSLHSKLSDGKWAQRFANFNNSDMPFLLAADVSGAELELNSVDQVINYDVPNNSDEYRFRAALLNTEGSARIVSLVSKQDRDDISELQDELGQTPDEEPLPDEIKKKVKKRREKKPSNGRQNKRKKKQEMELPQPSYEKLSGGRSGNHNDKKTGVVKFFKKLFS
jgi:superfamily II DNA/RNA helicase